MTDGSLAFNVSTSGEDFQTNLIMPEPCPFLSRKFPVCSIIRPVSTDPNIFGAMAAVKGLTADGLFTGRPIINSLRSYMTLRRMPMRRRASVIGRISAKA